MSLINREALLSFEKMDADLCASCGEHHTAKDVIMMIKTSPTVDAVPVVRCAKCEHWVGNDDGQYVCALFDIANSYGEPVVTKQDDFCSYGKRKGEVD